MAIIEFDPRKTLIEHNFDAALELAAKGSYVFPCKSEGNDAKAPGYQVFWHSFSTSNAPQVRSLWNKWPTSMPGIDTGKTGWLVVDCDRKRSDGLAWFLNYCGAKGGNLDGVPYVETPSGGRHYIFKNPDNLGCSRGSMPDKSIADIDIKGKGGYVIGAGSSLTNGGGEYVAVGDLFNAPTVPMWLHELLSPAIPPLPKPITVRVDPSEMNRDRMAAYGQNALIREFEDLASKHPGERNVEANRIAFRIGQLVGGGCLTFSEAYQTLEAAVLSWGVRPNDKALGPKGTLARALKSGERSPRGPNDNSGPVVEILLGQDEQFDAETGEVIEVAPSLSEQPGELPDHLTQIPGLVGDITDWIADTALYPQRGLALGAALTIVGTAAGRHMAGGNTACGTHLYVVGLAPSGAGKNHPLTKISTILAAAGMQSHIGPSQFISMPAVINFLGRCPLSVCAMDEFGSFLKRINSKKASGFEGAISGLLRTAWGLAFESMQTPEWAGRQAENIASPAMSIFGVSTADEFYDSLEGGDINNGVLNRFLLIETKIRPLERTPLQDPRVVPQEIIDGLKAIYNRDPMVSAQLCQSRQSPPYITVPITDDAERIRKRLIEETNHIADTNRSLKPFVARTAENAIRLATIVSTGRPGWRPQIDADAMAWARDFAMWSTLRMAEGAGLYIADSDTQATANAVKRAIQERGGRVKRRDLIRALAHKYETRKLDDIIKSLAEAEDILIEKTIPSEGVGRPSFWYSLRV